MREKCWCARELVRKTVHVYASVVCVSCHVSCHVYVCMIVCVLSTVDMYECVCVYVFVCVSVCVCVLSTVDMPMTFTHITS